VAVILKRFVGVVGCYLLFTLFFYSVFFCLTPDKAQAQDTRRSLLNYNALSRVNTPTVSKSRRQQSARRNSARRINTDRNPANDLQAESVDDVINSVEKREQIMTRYKGLLYLKYVNGVSNADLFEEMESNAFAEKLVVFQAGENLLELLKVSPIAELYKRTMRRLKVVKDYTSVQVKQGNSVQVDTGSERKPGKNLFELKLHASARRGVEPRIEIGDYMMISYDLLGKQTLIGYEFEF